VIRHILRRFERAAVAQEYRHAGAAKRVIAERFRQSGGHTAILHDAQHVAPCDGFAREPVRLVERLKQWRLLILDARSRDVAVQKLFRLAVQPDQLFLIAFFQQAQPGTLSLQPVVAAFCATTALTRAKVYAMMAMMARSRSPLMSGTSFCPRRVSWTR
jgi:hypothetical protein